MSFGAELQPHLIWSSYFRTYYIYRCAASNCPHRFQSSNSVAERSSVIAYVYHLGLYKDCRLICFRTTRPDLPPGDNWAPPRDEIHLTHPPFPQSISRCSLPKLSAEEGKGMPSYTESWWTQISGSHPSHYSAMHAVPALPVRIEASSVNMPPSVAKPRARPRSESTKRRVSSWRPTGSSSI